LEVGHEGRSWLDPHDLPFVLPHALKERREQTVALGGIIFAVPKAPEVAKQFLGLRELGLVPKNLTRRG
jgi:hypothetical protein